MWKLSVFCYAQKYSLVEADRSVCLHTCLHAYTPTWSHTHTHTYACTHAHVHACAHMHAHIHRHAHTHTHTHTHTCTHKHLSLCSSLSPSFPVSQQLLIHLHTDACACTAHLLICHIIHIQQQRIQDLDVSSSKSIAEVKQRNSMLWNISYNSAHNGHDLLKAICLAWRSLHLWTGRLFVFNNLLPVLAVAVIVAMIVVMIVAMIVVIIVVVIVATIVVVIVVMIVVV